MKVVFGFLFNKPIFLLKLFCEAIAKYALQQPVHEPLLTGAMTSKSI